MECKKHHCLMFKEKCLLRQQLALEKKLLGQELGTYWDCLNEWIENGSVRNNCKYGLKIKLDPDLVSDVDIRKRMFLYLPKPEKLELKINWKPKLKIRCLKPKLKIKKPELKLIVSNQTAKREILIRHEENPIFERDIVISR